ncbi:hypothetical protein [Mucilaginibacter sp.]|uniref:hypothetical protein n=1 Tax=Mucilaginibacter sp. TaxID=1882438 RepID=UPI003B00471C
MKKIYLTALLSTALLSTKAQQLIKQKDQFTGKEIKGAVINMGKIFAATGMTMGFGVINQKTYVYFTWPNPSGNFGAFNTMKVTDMALLFKLDDNSILKFKADSATSKITNFGNTSILSIGSEITNAQLQTLSSHTISVIRVGFKDDAGLDLEDKALFTDKNRDQVKKAAAFMIE